MLTSLLQHAQTQSFIGSETPLHAAPQAFLRYNQIAHRPDIFIEEQIAQDTVQRSKVQPLTTGTTASTVSTNTTAAAAVVSAAPQYVTNVRLDSVCNVPHAAAAATTSASYTTSTAVQEGSIELSQQEQDCSSRREFQVLS
jgi:hypothetical protein